jgi:hypothetical protein
MLSRLVAASGLRLSVGVELPDAKARGPAIEALADPCTLGRRGEGRLDSAARLLDQVAARPGLAAKAIEGPPARSGDAAFDALLAGIAVKIADDAVIPRLRWTRSVLPAPIPWKASGTPAAARR